MTREIKMDVALSIAIDYLYNSASLYAARVKHGYRKENECNARLYPDILTAHHYVEITHESLWAICAIAGLDMNTLLRCARVYNEYYSYKRGGTLPFDEEKLYLSML